MDILFKIHGLIFLIQVFLFQNLHTAILQTKISLLSQEKQLQIKYTNYVSLKRNTEFLYDNMRRQRKG